MKRIACFSWMICLLLVFGCSSSPKLFVPIQSTENIPGYGRVQSERMLIHVNEYHREYSIMKVYVPGEEGLIRYSISVSNLDMTLIREQRRGIAGDVQYNPSTVNKRYIVPKGPFKFIIDGTEYFLDDYNEVTTDIYLVYGKLASLVDVRNAIFNCSQLSIDGIEISPDGITAIKKFLE